MTLHESLMVAPALVACGVLMVVMYAKQRQFQRPIEAVHTDKAPAAIGPYAQATKDAMGTVYVSGQVGFIPGSKTLDGDSAASQARRALDNLGHILEEAGSSMCRVLKTTVLLQSMDDFASVNTVYEEAFGDHRPARACFAVLSLPAGALVEIEAIALEL